MSSQQCRLRWIYPYFAAPRYPLPCHCHCRDLRRDMDARRLAPLFLCLDKVGQVKLQIAESIPVAS